MSRTSKCYESRLAETARARLPERVHQDGFRALVSWRSVLHFDRAAKVHTNDQAPQTHRGVVLVEGDAQEAAALAVLLLLFLLPDAAAMDLSDGGRGWCRYHLQSRHKRPTLAPHCHIASFLMSGSAE